MDFIKNCGVMVEPQEGMAVEELLSVASLTERCGYGYFFRSDHLLPTSRRRGLDSPECWTSLGAIARATRRVKFGTMVSPIGFRNPALLARMACTVNSLGKGRLQLGVGAGWYRDEYRAHGFEFPELGTRWQQFREALSIIRPLTQSGRVDFNGKYFSAHLDGLPELKDRIHLIVGGRAPSIVREALAFGDEWNFFIPVPKQFDGLKRELEGSGRPIGISQAGPFMLAQNSAQLRGRLRGDMRRRGVSRDEDVHARSLRKSGWLVGTVSDFAEGVNSLRERGVEKFYFQFLETEAEQIRLLASVLKGI